MQMSDSSRTDLNVQPEAAEPDATGAGAGDLAADTGSNLAGGNDSRTVAAVEDATGDVPTAASAAAVASGVTSLADAAGALSD